MAVEITDTGSGIPPEEQPNLFASFAQANGSSARRYGGSGLGLGICRRLVELMGGQIGVISQPGKGSDFRFTLLLEKPHGVASPNEAVKTP